MSQSPASPYVASDRIAGSLIGQAIGDALGRPVEGMDRAVCQSYIEEFLIDRKYDQNPCFDGQYSDDTQLARELAVSLIENSGFSASSYAAKISTIFLSGGIVGYGRATAAAAERLSAGVAWDQAGEPYGVSGNGAAMRAAPIGWVWHPTPELVNHARTQAMITHHDPLAQGGAIIVAKAVALAMQPTNLDVDQYIASLAEAASQVSAFFATELKMLPEILRLPELDAHARISAMGRHAGDSTKDEWYGTISPYVVPSVAWALYAYLRNRTDFIEVIAVAIRGGGDTDTTAAMAGAMCGAEVGLKGLPMDLAERVHDNGSCGFHWLVGLANKISDLRHSKSKQAFLA